MKEFFYKKFYLPILGFLRVGVSPKELAMAVAIGATFGIMPFPATSTILCAIVATVFKLNMGAIQLANYAVYPLQFLLFIPFIKTGTFIFGTTPLPVNNSQIVEVLKNNALELVEKIGQYLLMGIGAWGLLTPFIIATIYYVSLKLFSKFLKEARP